LGISITPSQQYLPDLRGLKHSEKSLYNCVSVLKTPPRFEGIKTGGKNIVKIMYNTVRKLSLALRGLKLFLFSSG